MVGGMEAIARITPQRIGIRKGREGLIEQVKGEEGGKKDDRQKD